MEDKVKKYIKNPVCIEAVQWTGYNVIEVQDFVGKACKIDYHMSQCSESTSVTSAELIIHTLEGNMHANIGDYIIRGIKGEYYPCKPDIFNETYHEV